MTNTADDSWIADKILAQEDKLREILQGQTSEKTHANPTGSEPDSEGGSDLADLPKPTPVDWQVETAAFAELVRFFEANPEDDCTFTAVTLETFAEPADQHPEPPV